jgi:hypothetical protein
MEFDFMLRSLTVASALAIAALAVPAWAQGDGATGGGDKVNQLIVYGNDPCPVSKGDEITVCARKPEGERFRIPEPLRGIDRPTSEAWNNKVLAYETVGRFGTNSCSPVGAGGFTGCTQQMIQKARAERANGTDVKFGELIQQEREKRLSTIDANAAEEQVSVEAEERAYEARQKAAADAKAAGTQPTAP